MCACLAEPSDGEQWWLGKGTEQTIAVDSASGRLAHWVVRGEDILSAACGFSLMDATNGETDIPSLIRITRKPDQSIEVESWSRRLELNVMAIYSLQESGAILIDCNVTDLAKRDRAITVSFMADLRPSSWGYGNTWMGDRLQVERLGPGRGPNQIDPFSGHKQSQIPLGSLDDGRVNIAFANSMRKTRFFSYFAEGLDDGAARLVMKVDLGLVGETANFPHQADFQFALLCNDGDTGVRGAFQSYYRTFPDCFAYRSPQGGWALWVGGDEALTAALECGMAYDQWEFDLGKSMESVTKIQKAGLKAMAYSEPWGVWHPIRPEWLKENWKTAAPKPVCANSFYCPIDTEAFKRELANDLEDGTPSDRFPCVTRDFVAKVLLNTAITGNHDEWIFHAYSRDGHSFPWTPNADRKAWASGIVMVNSSPYLPHPNRYDLQLAQLEYSANILMTNGMPKLDGVYLDSLVFYLAWDYYNFNREHWKNATVPLTFAVVDGKAVPAMHNALANAEFLAEFRRYCDRHGYFNVVNTWFPVTQYNIGFIDTLGAGEHSGSGLQKAADFRTFRFLAKDKPISTCDYRLLEPNVTVEEIDARCNLALMYAIMPGTSNGWDRKTSVDKIRQVMPKYATLQRTLMAAGWEVLTHATVDNGGLIERWGHSAQDGLYFTVRNEGDKEARLTVILPADKYPNAVFSGAEELLDGTPVAFEAQKDGWLLSLDIPAKRTQVLRLQQH